MADITVQEFRDAADTANQWLEWYETQRFKALLLAAAEQREQLDAINDELKNWQTWGVIEVAIRNVNVNSYVDDREKQIATLTARIAELEGKTDPRWTIVVEHITDSNAKLDELSRRLQSLGERTEP
jgi:hypothetical protein